MKSHDKTWAILLVIGLIGLLMWFLGTQEFGKTPAAIEIIEQETNPTRLVEEADLGRDTVAALFVCDNNRQIGANFKERGVVLNLSDERRIILPQTISASGARYANASETFIFWNKGSTAFVEENGRVTFENCNEVRAEIE